MERRIKWGDEIIYDYQTGTLDSYILSVSPITRDIDFVTHHGTTQQTSVTVSNNNNSLSNFLYGEPNGKFKKGIYNELVSIEVYFCKEINGVKTCAWEQLFIGYVKDITNDLYEQTYTITLENVFGQLQRPLFERELSNHNSWGETIAEVQNRWSSSSMGVWWTNPLDPKAEPSSAVPYIIQLTGDKRGIGFASNKWATTHLNHLLFQLTWEYDNFIDKTYPAAPYLKYLFKVYDGNNYNGENTNYWLSGKALYEPIDNGLEFISHNILRVGNYYLILNKNGVLTTQMLATPERSVTIDAWSSASKVISIDSKTTNRKDLINNVTIKCAYDVNGNPQKINRFVDKDSYMKFKKCIPEERYTLEFEHLGIQDSTLLNNLTTNIANTIFTYLGKENTVIDITTTLDYAHTFEVGQLVSFDDKFLIDWDTGTRGLGESIIESTRFTVNEDILDGWQNGMFEGSYTPQIEGYSTQIIFDLTDGKVTVEKMNNWKAYINNNTMNNIYTGWING